MRLTRLQLPDGQGLNEDRVRREKRWSLERVKKEVCKQIDRKTDR